MIAQGPTSGSPGKTFVRWGDGLTPNSTATLHFARPNGTEYASLQQTIVAAGHFEITSVIPLNLTPGTYTWWAIDGPTGKHSNVVSYRITAISLLGAVQGTLHRNSDVGPVLSGATVTCGTKSTITANNGTFRLSGIPSGDQVLRFSKSGYQSFSVTVGIPNNDVANAGDRWLCRTALSGLPLPKPRCLVRLVLHLCSGVPGLPLAAR